MNSLDTITQFLGWCTVINTGILTFLAIFLMTMQETAARIHSRMFGINEAELPRIFYQYMSNFKILVVVLNFVPYLALKLMA
jgi:hypothetical protein